MATITLDGQHFTLPDEVAANDTMLVTALKAVAPQIGEKPQISRETRDGTMHVTVVKQAGSKGAAPAVAAAPSWLQIGAIRVDGGTQARAGLHEPTVEEYQQALAAATIFPPLAVFHDGSTYWLADGFHRLAAARRNNADRVAVIVHQGSRREAMLYAVGANATHGLRRTNADKRRAVELLLRDEEWTRWSDGQIADRCGVSQAFVSGVRRELVSQNAIEMPAARQVQRGDQTYAYTPPPRPGAAAVAPAAEPEFEFEAAPVRDFVPAAPTAHAPRDAPPLPAAAPAPVAPIPVPVPIPAAPPVWEACKIALTLQILPGADPATRQVLLSGVNEATRATTFALVTLPACDPLPPPVAAALADLRAQHTAAGGA